MSRFELEQALTALSGSDDPTDKRRVRKIEGLLRDMGRDTLVTERTYEDPETVAERVDVGVRDDLPTVPGSREARLEAGRAKSEALYKEQLSDIRSPAWWQKATTPEAMEIAAQTATAAAFSPLIKGGPTTGPALGLMIPAEISAGVAAHQGALKFPWNWRYREEEEGLGEMGSWNPLKSSFWTGGTGALGSAKRGLTYGALGHSLGPLLSGIAQGGRRTLLGFKPGPYTLDPLTPIGRWGVPFLGRESLTAADREMLESFLKRYESVGLDAPSYRISPRAVLQGIPALSKVPFLGRHVAKQIIDSIGGSRAFFLEKLSRISPEFSKFHISEDMFRNAVKFTERQIREYGKLYDDAYDFVEKGGKIRGTDKVWKGVGDKPIMDLGPLKDAVAKVLGKDRALKSKPADIITSLTNQILDKPGSVSMRTFRNMQHDLAEELRRVAYKGDGYFDLVALDAAMDNTLKNFYTHADTIIGGDIGKQVYRNFKDADNAVRRFIALLKTPAGRKFKTVERSFGEKRHALPESGVRFEQGGTREVDDLFDAAFKNVTPKYLQRMKTILGFEHNPAAWNKAVRRKLDNAMEAATNKSLASEFPVFDINKFYKQLALDESDEVAEVLLKGQNMTVQDLKNVAKILSEHPITPEMQQMMVRRVGLAGPKALATLGVGGVVGTGFKKGVSGIASVLSIVMLVRLGGKMLANPKLIKNLTQLDKTEKQLRMGKITKSAYGHILTQAIRGVYEMAEFDKVYIDSEIKKIRKQISDDLSNYVQAVQGTSRYNKVR